MQISGLVPDYFNIFVRNGPNYRAKLIHQLTHKEVGYYSYGIHYLEFNNY